MEHIKVTDEWLYKYMPIVDDAIIESLEKQVNYEYKFSKKFEKKMQRVIWQENHSVIAGMKKIVERVAMFFVSILCIGLIVTLSVEAYREKFFATLKTIYEDSVLYSYSSREENMILEITEPRFLPKGYVEKERMENGVSINIFYENSMGEQITWEQMLIDDGSSIILDTEYDTQVQRIVNGHTATVYFYEEGNSMAYYEADNYVYLITADQLTENEILEILASMNI